MSTPYSKLLARPGFVRMVAAVRALDREDRLTGADWVAVLDLVSRQRTARARIRSQAGGAAEPDLDRSLAACLAVLLRDHLARGVQSMARPPGRARLHATCEALAGLVGCSPQLFFRATVLCDQVDAAALEDWLGQAARVHGWLQARASPDAAGGEMLLHGVIELEPGTGLLPAGRAELLDAIVQAYRDLREHPQAEARPLS